MSTNTNSLLFEKVDAAEIISFDVFDTLVHRLVKEPVDVFDWVAKHIRKHHRNIFLEHKHFLRNFKNIRVKAEADVRSEMYGKFRTYEVTLNDIYEYLYYQYELDLNFLQFLKETEVKVELEALYPNQHVKKIYDYALNQKKKVIVTTDMYLPKEAIKSILLKCGYELPFEIFCSGELKHSKHEGNVFAYICKQLGTKLQKIVHIGDNYESDYNIPVRNSCMAFHLDYKNLVQSKWAYDNKNAYTLTDSLISGVVQKIKLESVNSGSENPYFRVGYEVFGPVFTGYFLWVMNEIRKKPVDKILFFARDAYVIRNLYNKYSKQLGIDIEEEYVYISRASSLLPSFTDFTIDRLWFLFSGRGKRTVGKALKNIGIDYRDIKQEIEMMGFRDANDEISFSDEKFMSLLIRIPDEIQEVASTKRRNLLQYINKVVDGKDKVAIVDIGWTGNMQGGFGRLAKLVNPKINIDGYYLGTSSGLRRSNLLTDNEYHGYLLNFGMPEDLYNNVLSPGGIELLELAFVAPHGTTLGYTDGENNSPILESSLVDQDYQSKASAIQEGACRFIDEIMPILIDLGFENFVNTQWAIPFFNLVSNPSACDAELLGDITHTDSAVTTATRLPLAKKLPYKLSENDINYSKGYREAIWKKGFEKLNKL